MDKLENVLTPCCSTIQESVEFDEFDPTQAECPGCGDTFQVSEISEELNAIFLEGEWLEVTNQNDYGYLTMIELEDGTEWYIAETWESAGQAAADYWRDMANNDPAEFRAVIGDERLVQWAINSETGGETFKDWLELVESVPEEQWGSYDGGYTELQESEITESLCIDLGFSNGDIVIFRHN